MSRGEQPARSRGRQPGTARASGRPRRAGPAVATERTRTGRPRFELRAVGAAPRAPAAPRTPDAPRAPDAPHTARRRRSDDRDQAGPAVGGPLAHQAPARRPDGLSSPAGEAPVAPRHVGEVADRILTGVDAAGQPTARIELNLGDWAGVDVDLIAGARGLELNVFAATAAARRTIQTQLTELANALARRGLRARKIDVTVRRRDNRRGSRQDGRR